jgi:hypothetical protein
MHSCPSISLQRGWAHFAKEEKHVVSEKHVLSQAVDFFSGWLEGRLLKRKVE